LADKKDDHHSVIYEHKHNDQKTVLDAGSLKAYSIKY